MAFRAARLVRRQKPLKDEQQAELAKAYASADKDGDRILTAEEYKTAFYQHGVFVDEEWIKSTMEKIDLNGDGGISLEEFVGMNAKHFKGTERLYDRNKDGFIQRADFRRVSKKLKKDQIEAVFQTFDLNNDGKLCYEDFQKFMFSNDGDN